MISTNVALVRNQKGPYTLYSQFGWVPCAKNHATAIKSTSLHLRKEEIVEAMKVCPPLLAGTGTRNQKIMG